MDVGADRSTVSCRFERADIYDLVGSVSDSTHARLSLRWPHDEHCWLHDLSVLLHRPVRLSPIHHRLGPGVQLATLSRRAAIRTEHMGRATCERVQLVRGVLPRLLLRI